MKGGLRKITVNGFPFIYRVSDKYHAGKELNTLTVKVFLDGEKRTPLTIEFLTMENYFVGQLLNKHIGLFHKPSNSPRIVNLNEPGYIRELIEFAFEKGWTGKNRIGVQNGIRWLSELGYDVSELEAEVQEILPVNEKLEKLGYTRSWLYAGVLTREALEEQVQLFDRGEDPNTEHYRYAVCMDYLQSKETFSEFELERFFDLLRGDPDTQMAGSAAMNMFEQIELTDEQFDWLSWKVSVFGEWTGKIVFRYKLLRKLRNEEHTDDLIGECMAKGDSFVQDYLLDHCQLTESQLQELSVHGKNKQIRTVAKSRSFNSGLD